MRIWVPGVVILVAVVGLIVTGIKYGAIPELHVQQVLAGAHSDQEIKVLGVIESIESEYRPLVFKIRDMNEPQSVLSVEIDDVRPDLFKVNNDVAVIGFFDIDKGCLTGDKVFTKCPSKYEASEQMGSAPQEKPPASETEPKDN